MRQIGWPCPFASVGHLLGGAKKFIFFNGILFVLEEEPSLMTLKGSGRNQPGRTGTSRLRALLLAGALGLSLAAPANLALAQEPMSPLDLQLFQAVQANDADGVRSALAAGADPAATDEWGTTAADLAVDKGYFDIVQILLQAVDNPQPTPAPPAETAELALPEGPEPEDLESLLAPAPMETVERPPVEEAPTAPASVFEPTASPDPPVEAPIEATMETPSDPLAPGPFDRIADPGTVDPLLARPIPGLDEPFTPPPRNRTEDDPFASGPFDRTTFRDPPAQPATRPAPEITPPPQETSQPATNLPTTRPPRRPTDGTVVARSETRPETRPAPTPTPSNTWDPVIAGPGEGPGANRGQTSRIDPFLTRSDPDRLLDPNQVFTPPPREAAPPRPSPVMAQPAQQPAQQVPAQDPAQNTAQNPAPTPREQDRLPPRGAPEEPRSTAGRFFDRVAEFLNPFADEPERPRANRTAPPPQIAARPDPSRPGPSQPAPTRQPPERDLPQGTPGLGAPGSSSDPFASSSPQTGPVSPLEPPPVEIIEARRPSSDQAPFSDQALAPPGAPGGFSESDPEDPFGAVGLAEPEPGQDLVVAPFEDDPFGAPDIPGLEPEPVQAAEEPFDLFDQPSEPVAVAQDPVDPGSIDLFSSDPDPASSPTATDPVVGQGMGRNTAVASVEDPTLFSRMADFLGVPQPGFGEQARPGAPVNGRLPSANSWGAAPQPGGAQRVASADPTRPIPGRTRGPLVGDDLVMNPGLRIGNQLSGPPGGLGSDNPCVEKAPGQLVFCVEQANWPPEMEAYFQVNTIMYQGTKVIVRYDQSAASRFHALFPTEAYDALVAFYRRIYGPPTESLQRSIAPLGAPREANPQATWQSINPETNRLTTLEIRKFDDSRGGFPDTERGAVMLYDAWSEPIFPALSELDLMFLRR